MVSQSENGITYFKLIKLWNPDVHKNHNQIFNTVFGLTCFRFKYFHNETKIDIVFHKFVVYFVFHST